ncbi:hypothetical protein HDV02_004472 [Globomyces sp. JEL0801]|nr:hypothetical protein HDV02_004472 [Globomyces sp. JEL0801]
MVKVKGYRIELDEVAKAVSKHPSVTGCAVLVKDNYLVAYLTPADADVDDIREMVYEMLPTYMIPASYFTMEKFPLNSNEKIDKNSLLAIDVGRTKRREITPTEIKIGKIWSQLLNVDESKIFTYTSFFAIGGDSISAIILVDLIKKAFLDIYIDAKVIFKRQTLDLISRYVDEQLGISSSAVPLSGLNHFESIDSLCNGPDDVLTDTRKIYRTEFRNRPLKVVCFHGQATSASVLDIQLAQIKRALGSKIDFHYIQATNETQNSYLAKYYDSKWYEWWPTFFIQKKVVDDSLNHVLRQLKDIGHVDALLGFSQGSTVIELLDRKAELGEFEKSWNFSILLSGSPIKSITLPKHYQKGVKGGIKSPALLVNGFYEREILKNKLLDRYNINNRELIEHDKGHEIPQNEAFTRRLAVKILQMAITERKNHPSVTGCAVLVKDNYLVAYLTPADADVDDIREMVYEMLPTYMIPASYFTMEKFPLNSNEKIDKNSLLAIDVGRTKRREITPTEIKIGKIWSQLLNVDESKIFTYTSFFAIGGDSISAIILVDLIKKAFLDIYIDAKVIFKRQTLDLISRYVDEQLGISSSAVPLSGLNHFESIDSLCNGPDDVLTDTRKIYRTEFRNRPLKVVCFHGQATSASVLDIQLAQIKRALGSKIDFHYIQATNETQNSYLAKYYDSKWYEWWPTFFIQKKVVDDSLNHVLRQLKDIGHVDALLGFSQGSTVIELLDRKAELGEFEKSWNFSILLSGSPIKSITLPKHYQKGVKGGIKSPALLVNGFYEREILKNKLLDRYNINNRELIEHDKGHEIPQNEAFTRRLAVKILQMAITERKNQA